VFFHTFGDSSIDLTVFFWEDTSIASPACRQGRSIDPDQSGIREKEDRDPTPDPSSICTQKQPPLKTKNQMKILTVLTYYRPHTSGLTIYAERLARAFVKRGHQVTVMTTQYDPSCRAKK
jgi:hypothetical protein